MLKRFFLAAAAALLLPASPVLAEADPTDWDAVAPVEVVAHVTMDRYREMLRDYRASGQLAALAFDDAAPMTRDQLAALHRQVVELETIKKDPVDYALRSGPSGFMRLMSLAHLSSGLAGFLGGGMAGEWLGCAMGGACLTALLFEDAIPQVAAWQEPSDHGDQARAELKRRIETSPQLGVKPEPAFRVVSE